MATKRTKNKEFYFIDLFAGSGGFSLGLKAAGFTPLGSVEINPVAQKTLKTNFGEPVLDSIVTGRGDVTRVNVKRLRREMIEIGVPKLDLLVACPPCQAFSRVGRSKLDSLAGVKGAHPKDPRNQLYKNIGKYLRELKPNVFVFENVPGMLSVGGKNIAEKTCKLARKHGYNVKATILNAAWYGSPQIRKRIIIIGYHKSLGIEPVFPVIRHNGPKIEGQMSVSDSNLKFWKEPSFFVPYSKLRKSKTTKPFVTTYEALCDLPPFREHLVAERYEKKYRLLREFHPNKPYRKGGVSNYGRLMRWWEGFESDRVHDHYARWTPRDFRIFKHMKEGDKYPDALRIANNLWCNAKKSGRKVKKKEFVPPYSDQSFTEKWRKLIRSKPSWTLTAHLSKDSYSHIHYDSSQARTISIREAARLQSFPDGFKFNGSTGDIFAQIGNAVPPLLSKAIGKEIRTQLLQSKKCNVRINSKTEVKL